MAAATTIMTMPVSSPPNERSSRGSPRSRIDVQSRSKCDFMERFFSWSDTVFCQHPTGTIPFSKPDDRFPNNEFMLQFVFENAESFTFVPSDGNDHNNDDHDSEVEQGQGHKRALQQNDHDLVDFCFDHVESLVCTEGNEDLVLNPIPNGPESKKKRSLTTSTTGNHRGAKITRTTTKTVDPTITPSTTKYGLYQEGIVPVRAKLKINSVPKNIAIVSC